MSLKGAMHPYCAGTINQQLMWYGDQLAGNPAYLGDTIVLQSQMVHVVMLNGDPLHALRKLCAMDQHVQEAPAAGLRNL